MSPAEMNESYGDEVSFDRLRKLGIEPVIPGLQGEWLIHYMNDSISISTEKPV